MKKLLSVTVSICFFSFSFCQQLHHTEQGGGEYQFEISECVSKELAEQSIFDIETNRALLISQGILSVNNNREQVVSFQWPMRLKAGVDYPSYYAISNYVDHNANFPNQIQDYNCGSRTYDAASGYNHAGTDMYLWPFSWLLVENNEVEVIAAADGIIIAKYNGNYDKSCTLNTNNWNAVYVQHSDGSVAWYGHLKNGSLTSKNVGQIVTQGEYLGVVASSGNSTGPHLHFEVRNASNQVIDPWTSTCNTGSSMWANQRPYYDPYINRVMTHGSIPIFPSCPAIETTNEKINFQPGNKLVTIAYLRDQQIGGVINYKLYRPNGAVDYSWSKTFENSYTSSYWYYTFNLPANAMHGTWTFEAKMNGQTVTTNFNVGTTTGIINKTAENLFSVQYFQDEQMIKTSLLQNKLLQQIQIYDILGKSLISTTKNEINTQKLSKGLYIVVATDTEDNYYVQKVLVE